MKQTETVANAYQVTFVLNDPAHSGLDRLTNTKFFYILDPGGKVRAFLPEWIPSDRLTRVLQNLVSSSTGDTVQTAFCQQGTEMISFSWNLRQRDYVDHSSSGLTPSASRF